MGIRELKNDQFTSAFSFLFSDRSDLVLCSLSKKDIHRWMLSVKECGVPILVTMERSDTLAKAAGMENKIK